MVEDKKSLYFNHNVLHYSSETHVTNYCEFNTTHDTDTKRKCPIDRNPPNLPHAVTFLPRFNFLHSFSSLAIPFTQKLVVLTTWQPSLVTRALV